MKNTFTKLVLLGASALTLVACSQSDSSDLVATGNNVEVTQDELVSSMKAQVGENVLAQLILTDVFENNLGEDKAKELKNNATTETASVMAQYGGEEGFNEVLAQSGFSSKEAYENTLYYYNLMNEAVSQKIQVSDEEIQKAYDEYEPTREVSHILVEKEDQAKDIIEELNNDGDFAELAKEHSLDTTAENGGSLGEVSKGQMVAEFEKEAFSLKEGDYSSKPVKSEFGFHIVKVDKVNKKASLEDERNRLSEEIKQSKLANPELVKEVIQGYLDEANVTIKDKDLENALSQFKAVENPEDKTGNAKTAPVEETDKAN